MHCRWPLLLGALAVSLLLTTPALAETSVDSEASLEKSFDELVAEAQAAFEAEDYEDAIEYLVLARYQQPEPALYLNIARSYGELNQCHRQLAYYRAFLDNPVDDQALIERAESAIEKISPECDEDDRPRTGLVALESTPPGAEVFVDDESVGHTPTEIAALEAGSHTFRFELEDHRDETVDKQLEADATHVDIEVELREHEDDPAETTTDDRDVDPVTSPDDPETGFSPHPVALGLLGLGVGAGATGAVLDFWRLPRLDDQRREAHNDGDQERFDELTDSRQNVATGAVIGYVAGGVLAAGAVTWLGLDYYSHSSDDDADTQFGVGPRFDDDAGGLVLFGRF